MSLSIVSAKGWVVIPKELRERYGFTRGTRVRFVDYGGSIGIVPEPADAREALGMLDGKYAGEAPLTADLLAEHSAELEREER